MSCAWLVLLSLAWLDPLVTRDSCLMIIYSALCRTLSCKSACICPPLKLSCLVAYSSTKKRFRPCGEESIPEMVKCLVADQSHKKSKQHCQYWLTDVDHGMVMDDDGLWQVMKTEENKQRHEPWDSLWGIIPSMTCCDLGNVICHVSWSGLHVFRHEMHCCNKAAKGNPSLTASNSIIRKPLLPLISPAKHQESIQSELTLGVQKCDPVAPAQYQYSTLDNFWSKSKFWIH